MRECVTARTIPDCLNVRIRPDLSATSVALLSAGSEVKVLAEKGQWLEILLPGNAVMWVSALFLDEDGIPEEGSILRSGPSVAYEAYGSIGPTAGKLTVLEHSRSGKWLRIVPLKGFSGYVNAKYVGVAQNRPRFILFALREDVFKALKPTFNSSEAELFASAEKLVDMLRNGISLSHKDLTVWDLNTNDEKTWNLFSGSFLAPLAQRRCDYVSVREAIGDLEVEGATRPSVFVRSLNRTYNPYLAFARSHDQTNRLIDNQPRVRRRFRIYQVMAKESVPQTVRVQMSNFIAGKRDHLTQETWETLRFEEFLLENGSFGRFATKADFEAFLREHLTKKQTQRALISDQPAPAALSIPDDACHYRELRTLSAREMARIQSFPDGFKFRSKMTTGGSNRRFEVPIYTQIGNAVPVMLGAALGEAVKTMLGRLTR